MTNTAVVLPVAVLASICVAMFVFMWWWFPRHYRKGVEMDMAEVDEARRQREWAAANPQPVGENGEQTSATTKPQPRTITYVPPVTAY